MTVLVTGAAGFIGMHVAARLLERGQRVLGLDDLNDYYSVELKRDRLARLQGEPGFSFVQVDVGDPAALGEAVGATALRAIVHLAAQAGVRHSLERPFDYARSNLTGHLAVLELARAREDLEHLVYASSSSVYGANERQPFSVEDRVDLPVSLYAATKRSGELMSQSYAHLYRIRQTGLRFFTVYGPWYRPDMALWRFAEDMLEGRPIRLFNRGRMRRDFTHVDDATEAVLAALDRPPSDGLGGAPHRLYNVGRGRAEQLLDVVAALEAALGVTAQRALEPMQPGDVEETFADIGATRRDLSWEPRIDVAEGVRSFADWYRDYRVG